MKKSIILSLAVLSLSSVSMLSAGGGDAFAGGMAGGMLGGVLSGAMQPREKTVVVQQPAQQSSSEDDYRSLKRQNDQLQRANDELERRLERLEDK